MKDFAIKYLSTIHPDLTLVAGILIILSACIIFQNRKAFSDFFNSLYNRKKHKEELLQMVHTQKSLIQSVRIISQKIDDLQRNTEERFRESEQRNNKRIRAELKDKISQSYRYYHSTGKINAMELEALEDLIEEYEAADGKNSFVHSVVQKEMYTWEKIDQL